METEEEKETARDAAGETPGAAQDAGAGNPQEADGAQNAGDAPSVDGADGDAQETRDAGADPRDAEIAQLKERLAAAEDRYMRTLADFDNYRKRSLRDREDFAKTAAADAVKAILPTVDNLARALESASPGDPLADGVKLSYDSFLSALSSIGAEKIPAAGEKFDPNLHEALAQMPSADVEAGFVMQEYRSGWTLNGKLLRAAQVVVSSGSAAESAEKA